MPRKHSRRTGHTRTLVSGQAQRLAHHRPLSLESLEHRYLLAAGMLDPTFGAGGWVTTDFGEISGDVRSVAVQNDGKIVVAGTVLDATFNDWALVRYNSDGTLDSTFGDGGKVFTDFGGRYEGASKAILQRDGKILVAGYTGGGGSDYDFALARYDTDGVLDATFGSAGKVTTDFGGLDDLGRSVALQSDDKIVVAGSVGDQLSSADFALARYNSDGTLDASFAGDGHVTTDLGAADVAWSMAAQSDGKIVLAGSSYSGSNGNFALIRYNADGTLDLTFGQDGKVNTVFEGRDESATDVVVQNDGKIIVAGGVYALSTNPGFAVARYNPDGTLNSSFDGDGMVVTRIGLTNDYVGGVAVQSNGKIVVAGRANLGGPRFWDFVLVRYNTDGTLDSTFNGDGKVSTHFGLQSDRAYSVALQSDGQIIVAGSSGDVGITSDFAIARYEGDPIPPPLLAGDYNRSGTVDAADYVLWRKTQGAVVAAYGGADGDGDGTIDQDDYDLWQANLGRTLPLATSAALAAPAPLANPVTAPSRSSDLASSALMPKERPHNRGFQPTKRHIVPFATLHNLALLAWMATKPAGPGPVLSTADFSWSPREPIPHASAIQLDGPLDVAFASIAESVPNDLK